MPQAMKGVFAIGAGVIAQRNLGANFMGLLLTYGLKEISELARFLKISTEHVFGVAGLGDLIATCFSLDSRNVQLGQMLAAGTAVKDALAEVEQVVGGYDRDGGFGDGGAAATAAAVCGHRGDYREAG